MTDLQTRIESAFEQRATLTPQTITAELRADLTTALAVIDNGSYRVA